ncbi:hypothetical protein V8F33_004729 [Rhypophila sp. PSN 637]
MKILNNNGPPGWRGKTAQEIKLAIMAKTWKKPCYGSAIRAWKTLGYKQGQRPTDQWALHRQLMELWNFLVDNDGTVQGHTVRAFILDALEAVGIRYTGKTTDSRGLIWMAGQAQRISIYNALPDPVGDNQVKADGSSIATFVDPVTGNQPRMPVLDEMHACMITQNAAFDSYQRFQGFCAIETTSTGPGAGDVAETGYRFFQGVPIPYTPNSLWDAVAWWRGDFLRHGLTSGTVATNRWPQRGFVVKGRIYTWFMQTIKDQGAIRFKDYWKLQQASIVRDDEFGELSLIRSLHASVAQGRPAYPTWWNSQPDSETFNDRILHVIADYFCTQVIVFYSPGSRTLYNNCRPYKLQHMPEFHGSIPPQSPGGTPYFVRAYGEANPGQEQIWLVTSDWIHFDAAIEDDTVFRRYGYFPTQDPKGSPLAAPALPPPVPPRPAYPPANHVPTAPGDASVVVPPSESMLRGNFSIARQHITRMPHSWWGLSNLPPLLAYDPQDPVVANRVPPFRNAKFNFFSPERISGIRPPPIHDTPVLASQGPIHTPTQQNIMGIWGKTLVNEPSALDWGNRRMTQFWYAADIDGVNFEQPSAADIHAWQTWNRHPNDRAYTFNQLNRWQLRFGRPLFVNEPEKGNMGMADPFYRFKPIYGFENF